LIPNLYADLDVVSRELTGLIPAVTIDASLARGKVGQSVYIPVAPSNTSASITPAMTIPAEADQTIASVPVTISKAKAVKFSWDGEEERGLNTGPGVSSIWRGQFAQALRVLVNEVEADLAGMHVKFSRAHGAANTVPFNTAGDFSDASQTLRILKDNGAPLSDNQLVVNTNAGANFLGKQAEANRQGTDTILRQGVFQTVSGMDIRESGQIVSFTAGAMANATTSNAALTVGQTVLPLAAAGTGVVAAGDIITLANDTNKYVVTAVSFAGTNPGASDTITIAQPGIRVAQGAATRAITVVATSSRNMAFNRSAIVLATRLPERPSAGDMAIDVTTLVDPRSGLAFEVAVYPGYRKVVYEVSLAWGYEVIKPAHTALLIGTP
jgi:flagellar hook assembly protein FlgD